MLQLTGKQKRFLRGLGHHLKPLIHLGKEGLKRENLIEIQEQLRIHELIKIKLLKNTSLEMKDSITTILKETDSNLVQVLGKTILLYRSREENPEIFLP